MHARKAALTAALLALAAAIHGCSDDVTPPQADNGEYGSLVNAEEFANAAQALPPAALTDPPSAITVPQRTSRTLTNLPAIAMQGTPAHLGSPGSCEAQSFAYGLGSYTAARNPDYSVKWDASQPQNEVSAAYQFALAINNGFAKCSGGLAKPYLGRIAGFGSPSVQDVPYEPSCAYFASVDLDKPYPNATRLRVGSFATFAITPANGIQRIKEYVANQQAVAFSGSVYNGYGNAGGPPLTDGYFYAPQDLKFSGGHGQLVVGFDDDQGATGRTPGVLLIQNSFGTAWPASDSKAPRGMLYWSYETFTRTQQLAAVAYPYDPSPPSGTILTANDPRAPVASIKRAYQWAPTAAGDVWLILIHHLADPVRITQVGMTEPGAGGRTAIGGYGQFLSWGYTYFRRTDGKAFLPGVYQIKYQAQTLDGQAVAYTGSVTVGVPLPNNPAAASFAAAGNGLFDSLGQVAFVGN